MKFWSSLLMGLLLSLPALADGPARATLAVNLGLRSNRGSVYCALYDGPNGFPTVPKLAAQIRKCTVHNAASTCSFDNLGAGNYAVGCFHDENANGRLDRGLFGVPKEGVVASNHARALFGPPKFAAAKFWFAGSPSHIDLRMGY